MKVIICNIFVILGLIVATIFGIYAQDISYYLNEQFPTIGLRTAITVVTFLSIGLYLIISILLFISKKRFNIFFIGCIVLGIFISMWSFFVWAMWMG